MRKFLTFFLTALLAFGVGWAGTVTLTLSDFPNLSSSYVSGSITKDGITYSYTDFLKSTPNIQVKKTTGEIHNVTPYSGVITSVAITHSGTANPTTISGSSDGTNWNEVATGSGSITGDFSNKGYKYFKITRGSGVAYWEKIEITYGNTTKVATPTFSPEPKTYTEAQDVSIFCTTAGATIHYTTNGDTPDENSAVYSTPISVDETMTIKAIAIKDGMEPSGIAEATYTIEAPLDPNQVAILDFTSTDYWPEIPTGTAASLDGSYSDGTYTIYLNGTGDLAYDSQNKSYYLLLGKTNASLTLPAFTKAVKKIVVEGRSGASTQVEQNIFVGENAVSNQTTGATGTNFYEIASGYQSAGNIYTLKILNDKNTQIKKIYIYFDENAPVVPVITVDPTNLPIHEQGGTITVTGENVDGNISAELGTTTDWSMTSNLTSEGGTVTVNYSGKPLGATNKVTFSATGAESVEVPVNYTYTGDIYILGNVGGRNYWAPNEGLKMTRGEDGLYTATRITTTESDKHDRNSYFSFSKVLANNNDEGGWNYIKDYRFVPESSGNWVFVNPEYNVDHNNEYWPLDYNENNINNSIQVPVGTYTITIDPATNKFKIERYMETVATPEFSVAEGTYDANQTVSISCETEGATIYYTLDGSDPDANSAVYSTPLTVSATTTIKAIAMMDGWNNSAIASATYTINKSVIYEKVTSTDDVTSGNYLIVYEDGTTGYALDGSITGTFDTKNNNKEVEIKNGKITTSDAIYFTYDVNAKTLKSASGKCIGNNGSTTGIVSTDGTALTNTISIDNNGDAVITAWAGATNTNTTLRFNANSDQMRFRYYASGVKAIQLYKEYNPNKVATPTFSPAAGTYTSVQTVTISCATDGATILYSTDGTNWTQGTTVNVTESCTLYAKATKTGKEDSNVATATYTINLPASVSSIAAVNALEAGTNFVFNNKAVVVYRHENQMWIQDHDINENTVGGALVYGQDLAYNANDVLAADWTGTTNIFSGNKQIINLNAQTDGTKEPVALKRTSLAPVNEQEYVLLEGVTISNDLKITLDTRGEVVLYTDKFGLYSDFTPKEGFTYNVKGIFDIYNDTYEIYPLSIELNKKDVNLAFGETPDIYVGNEVTLTVTGAPEGVNVTFECDPEGAVTFDGNKATFKTEGPVTITATTAATDEYNAGEVSKTFNVQAKTTPTLTFEPNKVELYVGQEFTAPTLTTDPEGLEVTYTVTNNDPEVVIAEIVNGAVVVNTSKAGTATVTATYAGSNQYNNTSASYPITISKKDVTLAFGDTPDIYVGNEVTLTVTGAPEGATVNFVCAPEGAVTFDGNKATFNTQGEVTITAKTAATNEYNAGEVSKIFNVQAKKEAGLSFGENPNVEITLGDTFTAPQLVNPYNLPVTWTSSNPDVATVDQDGNVTLVAGAIGSTTITATYTTGEGSGYETGSAHYTITVNDVVVAIAAPTFAPAAGTYTEPKEVAIACATPGVTITYAIDGVDKGEYNGPFTISDGEHTVTATAKMGTRTVYTPATSSATYTINAADAATITDDYYFLQSNAAEVSGKYANVAGRRTLNFVADADKQAGTVFRIQTGEGGAVKTLRSQAVDLQGYANRAMAYVPKAIELVLSTLANSSLGDPETPGTGILGENGLDLILKKFYEGFDYNLYVEGTENAYRIYGRTPSMQHVVDFYHENTAQVEEKLPMLEGYINQVLDKIRSKIPAPYDANVVVPFSLKTVRNRIADKYGITLIDPTQDLMGFYRQVLNNKEYVWDFAYQTAMMYVDVIKETQTYKNLPDEYKLYVTKMEKVRPDTKYYIIERGNELDYISENNGDIIKNDPRTLWTLTKRENFTVNVPETNKLNDSYYTTLYTDFGYELPADADVKAYAVTGIDENDVAQLTEITGAIPAQTPVLLKANAAGTVNVTLTTAAGNTPETNLLEGPDYLVKTYGITSPTVEAIFNLAAAFVPADMLAEYEYLKLRTSGTVNNKYFWNVNDALEKLTDDCVVRSLAVKNSTLAFSEHWKTETNKAFLVSDTKPVIYLEKDTLAAPTFSPVPGSYTVDNGQNVTITITAEDDATIKYSTDGGKTWNTYEDPIAASDDMTIVAKAEKDGMIASDEVTAVYVIDIPAELPDVPVMKGYFQIMNNGNEKYAHVQGRKTLTFTDAPADKAGTVIWLETNEKGQVQSLRSQAADLQRYADRAMSYVPEIVELVADKLNADGESNLLGHEGLEKIMEKFNKSFDHHLYVEQAGEGWRLFGKTPSMQPVVEFYRENTAQVEAKLPMLESFINSALNKLKEKIGGQSVFTEFKLHDIWQKMGGTLTEPNDDASTMAFYREVLNNKNYVWDFAYQTAMIYVNNLITHDRWSEVEEYLGEYAQYIDKIDQIRPDFKYYVVQENDKPDFISEGNVDIKNNAPRTIWTVEPRTTFTVNIADNLFGCPLAGVGGYATTLYTDFAYTVPNGVTAYKVTSIDGGKATIEALSDVIPAQTPVLLTAKEAGTVTLTLSTEAGTAVTCNLLVGPDYLINEYDLKTTQVQELFDKIKEMLGQDFYDAYVAQYEHLADLNSGTVNNKYFWSVDNYLDDLQDDCVVRSLATDENGKLAFSEHWKTETNKAFLVSDTFDVITLPSLERGDVNHDGYVNLLDVADLIDRLLVIPDAEHLKACPYCSDVDGNGSVSIKDVTVLIDILLENPAPNPEEGDGN